MIFLTVGSELPFDRLVRAVDTWAERPERPEIFGQLCALDATNHHPKNFEWVPHLDPPEFRRRVGEANYIIGHAGMGTIIDALMHCKPLLMMPRRADLKETRNDHQIATARRFGARPGLHVAMDPSEIEQGIDRLNAETTPPLPIGPYAEERLIRTLHQMINNQADKRRC